MKRLAEYLADFSALLGQAEKVHFSELEQGSTVALAEVEQEAETKVWDQVEAIGKGAAPKAAQKAYARLNEKLREDNAVGYLQADSQKILNFPGKNIQEHVTFGPITKTGHLDGVVIQVGGRDSTVPVQIKDGEDFWRCNTSREIARELGPLLYGNPVRVIGEGTWIREKDGDWVLKEFNISNFEILNDQPLSEVIERLSSIDKNGWRDIQDPAAFINELRRDDD